MCATCGCGPRAEQRHQRTLDEATLVIRRGELDAARVLAEHAIALTRAEPDPTWNRRFTLLLAEVQTRRHDLSEARRLLSAWPPDDVAQGGLGARRRFLQGWAQMLDGDRNGAVPVLEQARQLAAAAGDGDLGLDIDVVAAITDLQLGRRETGESRLRDVLAAATARGDRYHQAVALLNLGYGQLVQKRYDAALTWLERVTTFEDLRDTTVYADALNNAGICYARLGLFDRAIEAQRRAVESHKGRAPREYEQALGQLGTTYNRANRYREGLPHLREALAVASGAGLAADAGIWAGNLADVSIALGEWDDAEGSTASRSASRPPPARQAPSTTR